MNVSIVIPIYNEVENIQRLYNELAETFDNTTHGIEFLFVNDGSNDGSAEAVKQLLSVDQRVRLVGFRRNFGQTAAMQAGIEHAVGDVIVTMDGDLQNDPQDIPAMLEKLNEGYDLVHGWRKQRHDAWLSRKLPSRIANWLISRSTKVPVNDLGCTLKAMRSEIAKELKLYGQMHRFIPILAAQRGARCYEMVTNHRARQFGVSKYGISRTVQVVLDLLTVKYLQSYFENPMKLFGKLGIACVAVAMAGFFATGVMKIMGGFDMTGNPLLLLSAFTFLASIQLFGLGLLGEVSARIFYETKENRPFAIDFDSNQPGAELKIYREAG